MSEQTKSSEEKVKKILRILEADNKVVRLNQILVFSFDNINMLKNKLSIFFNSNEILSMQDFKKISGTSRKYAVPLLEYFDKINFTYRVGDGRKLIK